MQLRNFLHVESTDKNKYELKYFNIDSKADNRSTRDAILSVFLRVFN
jgi:hypothetical protein